MNYYKTTLIVIALVVFLLVVINVLMYFFPDTFLPLPNQQPFKSVWAPEDKEDMKKLLTKSLEITRAHDIEMIAMFGTLMGLARHEGVIPWDDDLDFAVNLKDRDKLVSLKDELAAVGIGIAPVAVYRVGPIKIPFQGWKKQLSKLYLLDRPNISSYTSWSWPFIDIFYYSETDTEFLLPDNVSFPKTDIFPLKTNLFEGIPISIPNNTDSLLDKEYGSDWEEVCTSSGFNHRKERSQRSGHTALCKSVTDSSPTEQGIYDNVWVINLDRRPERWRTILGRLKQFGLQPHRWSATDKEDPAVMTEYNKLDPKIRQGEFACYKSHLNLWDFLYRSEVPYAIIFEDDISVPPGVLLQDVTKVLDNSKGFDVLLLGHCSAQWFARKPSDVTGIGSAMCLHAYAVSREGLRKLVEGTHDYSYAVDAYLHKRFCPGNLCYYAKDRAQSHRGGKIWAEGLFAQDDNFPTDIQNENMNILKRFT